MRRARLGGASCARAPAATHPNAKMRPMTQSLGGFRAALLAGWTALSAAGLLYARLKGIPAWVAVPVLAAFLVEYPFYLVPAFAEVRQRFERNLPWFLVVSFVAPYVVYASRTGQFRWWAVAQLAALATALSLWYRILPAAPLADGAFLVLVAAVVLRGYFDPIYTSPFAGLHVEILGHVALTRLCAMVMLVERRVPGVGYGFMPSLPFRKACGMEDRPASFRLLPCRRHSAGLGHAAGAPGSRHAHVEDRGYLCGRALGGGAVGGVLLSRPAATVDGPMDGPPGVGVGRRVDSVRHGAPGISWIPQLEIRARRGGGRLVLRPGLPADAEYPRQHGDTRAGGYAMAGVVCVGLLI